MASNALTLRPRPHLTLRWTLQEHSRTAVNHLKTSGYTIIPKNMAHSGTRLHLHSVAIAVLIQPLTSARACHRLAESAKPAHLAGSLAAAVRTGAGNGPGS